TIILSVSVTLVSAADCTTPWNSTQNYPGGSTVSYNGANWKNTWWENPGWAPGAPNGDGGWVSQGACGNVATSTIVPKSSSTTTTTTLVPKSSTTVAISSSITTTTTVVPKSSSTTTTTTAVVISTTAAGTTTGTSSLPYCYDVYVSGIIYNPTDPAADKKASLNGINYTAKYYTTSTPSPSASDWTNEGPCTPPPPPPPATAQCYPKWISGTTYAKDTIISENGINYQAKYQSNAEPAKRTEWVKLDACNITTLEPRPFDGKPGMIGYWAQWSTYTRPQTRIDLLDLSGFSAINYAFLNALSDGSLKSFDDWADYLHITRLTGTARVKYPNLRTVISVGGWSGSVHFSNIAKSPTATANFVKNIHKYIKDNGFDGIDIDWEYPGGGGLSCNAVDPNDAINFVTLLKALRAEVGPNMLLSIAASPNVERYVVNGVNYLKDIAEQLSYIQVMTYDIYGSWSPYADFNSALNMPSASDPQQPAANGAQFSIASSLKDFEKVGVPKSKLVPGVAFYGRSWNVASNKNNGLYEHCVGGGSDPLDLSKPCNNPVIQGDVLDDLWQSPCTGSSPDAKPSRSTVWMYQNLRGDTGEVRQQVNAPLVNGPLTASNGWTRQYFKFAETPTLYHPSYTNNLPTFISYDDPQSIEAKTSWAKSNGYAGIMAWELDQDYKHEMMNAMRSGWGI
ncbi:UNVERIFIED_CONTAM: hypothetical protein HDU68_003412, partial [Siphonaria sp. JEL0065]